LLAYCAANEILLFKSYSPVICQVLVA